MAQQKTSIETLENVGKSEKNRTRDYQHKCPPHLLLACIHPTPLLF